MGDLTCDGNPLVHLNEYVNWEVFRPELETIREKERKSPAGRKPFDAVLMFKVLVLQSLYNLSDDAVEYQIRDRLSFMRFWGLTLGDRVTDTAVHDSMVFGKLLDETNTNRSRWADSAYRSEDALAELERRGYWGHLQRKGHRYRTLTDWEKRSNRRRSRIRYRIEHVFGIQAQMAGNLILRTIGTVRAEVKIGLRNRAKCLKTKT